MSTEKIKRVNANDIVLFIYPNWYKLTFAGLVGIEEFRARYGINATAQKAVDDNVILLPDQPHVPMPPIHPTDEQREEIYIRELRKRWSGGGAPIVVSLKDLIAQRRSAFISLLASSILP